MSSTLCAQNMANEIADSQPALNNLVDALITEDWGPRRSFRPAGLCRCCQEARGRSYSTPSASFRGRSRRNAVIAATTAVRAILSAKLPLLDRNFFSNAPGMKLGAEEDERRGVDRCEAFNKEGLTMGDQQGLFDEPLSGRISRLLFISRRFSGRG